MTMTLAAVVAALYLVIHNVQLHLPGTPTQGEGITSLAQLKTDQEWLFLCGMKQGSLWTFSFKDDGVQQQNKVHVTNGRYPIFSMAVDENDGTVFCGGSDRFVTVLPYAATQHNHINHSIATVQQRLGPHTGWVQDVLLASPDLLYSIGCNCIESWQKQSDRKWKQGTRFVIESDVAMGCTLSSDLLCLACRKDTLYAGGVDGRIHAFRKEEISAMAAHKGRVNAIMTTTIRGIDSVLTASHDGWVYQWKMQTDDQTRLERVQAFQSNERNTAILQIRLDKNDTEGCFVVGTSRGTILLLSDSLDLLQTFCLPEPVAITVFLHVPDAKMVLVAHSLGLGAFHYSL
jgi:WD40 repeat protein